MVIHPRITVRGGQNPAYRPSAQLAFRLCLSGPTGSGSIAAMPDVIDQVVILDPDVAVWVRAFYAARGWSLEEPPAEPLVDPALAAQAAAYQAARDAAQALADAPPPGLPPDWWDPVRYAANQAEAALHGGDAGGAAQAVAAMLEGLRDIAAFRDDPAIQGAPVAAAPLFQWHGIDPPGSPQSAMGLRTAMADDGTIGAMKLAGRPRGKHGGAQGQHVTAFVTLREAAVSASFGRTPDQARENVQHMFAGLLAYPAFGPECPPPGPDPALLATVRGLARADETVWQHYSVDAALALYVEVRDAMPGATLPREAYADTTGKGEAAAVRRIGAFDNDISADTEVTKAQAGTVIADLRKLIDQTALSRLGDAVKERHARETFVLGIAQAFPKIFNCGISLPDGSLSSIGAELADGMILLEDGPDLDTMEGNRQTRVNDLIGRARTCAALPHPQPDDRLRPKVENFSVGLVVPGGDQAIKLDVVGRPADSIKEASTMGDHTTSMRLMSSAMGGALIEGDTDLPERAALADRLTGILDTFDPDDYVALFPPRDVEVSPTGMVAMDDQSSYRDRLDLMRQIHADLSAARDGLNMGAGQVSAEELLDLAEAAVRLFDQRPTAVTYGGSPSKGHNEGRSGGECDEAEARLAAGGTVNAARATAALAGLFDPVPAKLAYSEMAINGAVAQAACLNRIVAEFMWFATKAYPLLVEDIGADVVERAVRDQIDDADPSAQGDDTAHEPEIDVSGLAPRAASGRKRRQSVRTIPLEDLDKPKPKRKRTKEPEPVAGPEIVIDGGPDEDEDF
jgi:hypothetical protein